MQQAIERMITRQVERIIQKKLTAAVNQAGKIVTSGGETFIVSYPAITREFA
mgnify:CR=1 FL=1